MLSLVTIHHEGAGTPTDNAWRYGTQGYTYGVGPSGFTRFRSPYTSFATLHYNHVSVDICLSGNRMTSPVTDHDLAVLRQIYGDARARGDLGGDPTVRPHRATFLTLCPGDLTMQRWPSVVAAFRSTPPVTNPDPGPHVLKDDDMAAMIYPDRPLTNGPLKGKVPTLMVSGVGEARLLTEEDVKFNESLGLQPARFPHWVVEGFHLVERMDGQ